MKRQSLDIIDYGQQDYAACLIAMQAFTNSRTDSTTDQLWLLEHPPIYTQGVAGKAEHKRYETKIPLCQSDRGGQITYHGPGQLILYTLLDLKRLNLTIRSLVCALETITCHVLSDFAIQGHSRADAPGIYIDDSKIASLGLRVRRFRCFHGLALNVAMDLSPFDAINPCGKPNLIMTQMSEHSPSCAMPEVKAKFISHFSHHFGYNNVNLTQDSSL